MTARSETTPSSDSVPYLWSLPLSIDGKILNAAYSVLLEKGFSNTTVSEIAQRAGVSRPTLYRRFKDLDDITGSLVTSIVLDLMNRSYRLVDSVDELIDIIVRFVLELRSHPILPALENRGHNFLSRYFVDTLGTSQRELLAVLTSLVHHCHVVNPQQLRDADEMELAAMVLLLLQNTTISRKIMGGLITEEQWCHHIRYALQGLLKPDFPTEAS